MRDAEPPARFTEFSIGRARVICGSQIADAVRQALAAGTLYDYASRHPGARRLAGRGIAYAVPLPGGAERVVIRHNRHGGLLAPWTGDLFRRPSRAPYELAASQRLEAAGVPSSRVLGIAVYAAALGLCRADVMSREIPDAVDLSAALLADDAPTRERGLDATARLMVALSAAGARHHDLNIKNVLLRSGGQEGAGEALVLDVDRVTFDEAPRVALEHNLARLLRSARKWRTRYDARVSEAELEAFAERARAGAIPRATSS